MPPRGPERGLVAPLGETMEDDTARNGPKLIGAKEAAKRLRIHRKTLYRYTQDGKVIAATRLPSGVYRYDEAHIDALKEAWDSPEPALATA